MTVSATSATITSNVPGHAPEPAPDTRLPSRQVRRALERRAADEAAREDRAIAVEPASDARLVVAIFAKPDGSVRVKTNLDPAQQAAIFATLAQIAAQRLARSPIVGPGGEALQAATPSEPEAEPTPAPPAPVELAITEPPRNPTAGE